MKSNLRSLGKAKQNDPKRFIKETNITSQGEVVNEKIYELNEDTILEESLYDGLYEVCTNLEDNVEEIINF